jgi:hypothetical protein
MSLFISLNSLFLAYAFHGVWKTILMAILGSFLLVWTGSLVSG